MRYARPVLRDRGPRRSPQPLGLSLNAEEICSFARFLSAGHLLPLEAASLYTAAIVPTHWTAQIQEKEKNMKPLATRTAFTCAHSKKAKGNKTKRPSTSWNSAVWSAGGRRGDFLCTLLAAGQHLGQEIGFAVRLFPGTLLRRASRQARPGSSARPGKDLTKPVFPQVLLVSFFFFCYRGGRVDNTRHLGIVKP